MKFAPSGKALLFGTLQYETERKVGTVKFGTFLLIARRLSMFTKVQMVSWLQFLPGQGAATTVG